MSTLVRDPVVRFGRFRVLRRTSGSLFIYDPTQPAGRRAVLEAVDLADAAAQCKRLSDEATSRGEPNEVERVGFKLDWNDPATWEAMANVPPRPLFPSLLEHDQRTDIMAKNKQQAAAANDLTSTSASSSTSEAPSSGEQGHRADPEGAPKRKRKAVEEMSDREIVSRAVRRCNLNLDPLTETQRRRALATLVALHGSEPTP